ncbi:MAG TPA: hypothetical protein DDX39_10335 [Bacteroidales bacterium]|nr:MAG: hypothetical protein A2W98_15590 [Bacteroidetes bacterium GWF2_33_38]OFY72510.1 MAG: hypothetical protein A2265_04155 [Bacteroidetes bacterium RIFOXYA12_FULL_33_9]HBF89027.1 hypothetical protein [Bacteroidales bacterium]
MSNDHALNEYLKHKYFPSLIKNFKTYFTFSETLDTTPIFKLYIDKKNILYLEKQINDKLSMEDSCDIFGMNDFEYVPAKIIDNNNIEHTIEIRLRGDMSSNYKNGLHNATYRFNIKDSSLLFGKRKLSLVRPELENYGFYGFLFYKFFRKEGIISNDFKFINLYFNNTDVGVYILQEGFSGELITSCNRSGGIIFRLKNDCEGYYNSFPELEPYMKKKIFDNKELIRNFKAAKDKIDLLEKSGQNASDCFDMNLYGKFYALSDIFLSHHATLCQNVKLWFNEKTQLFEPIAWDPANYIRYDVELDLINKGHNYSFDSVYSYKNKYPLNPVLSNDSTFLFHYSKYLYDYSHNDSIFCFIKNNLKIIESIEPKILRQDFQSVFQPEWILSRINEVKKMFRATELVSASLSIKDSTLSIRSTSNLPIRVESITINNCIIEINKIILPKEQTKININIGSIKTNTHEFDLIFSYLYPIKNHMYKGVIF